MKTLLAIFIGFGVSACANSDSNVDSGRAPIVTYKTYSEMGACTELRQGQHIFVEEGRVFFECTGEFWIME